MDTENTTVLLKLYHQFLCFLINQIPSKHFSVHTNKKRFLSLEEISPQTPKRLTDDQFGQTTRLVLSKGLLS